MKKFFPFAFVFFLFSCTSTHFESQFSPVYVTNSSKFAILPTSAMNGEFDGVQQMTANFGKNSVQAEIYVLSDSETLAMTVFSEFGTTIASLVYDDDSIDFESSVFPENLKAEYIIADFQFCLYDASELKSALEKIGVNFEESIACPANEESGTVITRTLSKKKKIISKITKTYAKNESGGEELKSIRYENFLRGYSYELLSIE